MSVLTALQPMADVATVGGKQAPAGNYDDVAPSWWTTIGAAYRAADDAGLMTQSQRLGTAYHDLATAVGEKTGKSALDYFDVGNFLNPFEATNYDTGKLWNDIEAVRKTDPKAFPGIEDSQADFEQRVYTRGGLNRRDAAVAAAGGWLPRQVGTLAAGLVDPVNLLIGALSGGGAEAGGIAMGILKESAANAGAAAFLTPFEAIAQGRLGNEMTPGEAAENIVMGGAVGGVTHLGMRGAHAAGGAAIDKAMPGYRAYREAQRLEFPALTTGDMLSAFANAKSPEDWTPTDLAAHHVATQQAGIDATSPYEDSHAGLTTHRWRLANGAKRYVPPDPITTGPDRRGPLTWANMTVEEMMAEGMSRPQAEAIKGGRIDLAMPRRGETSAEWNARVGAARGEPGRAGEPVAPPAAAGGIVLGGALPDDATIAAEGAQGAVDLAQANREIEAASPQLRPELFANEQQRGLVQAESDAEALGLGPAAVDRNSYWQDALTQASAGRGTTIDGLIEHPDIGTVDVPASLARAIAERSPTTGQRLPEILAAMRVDPTRSTTETLHLTSPDGTIGARLDYDRSKARWLLTDYQGRPARTAPYMTSDPHADMAAEQAARDAEAQARRAGQASEKAMRGRGTRPDDLLSFLANEGGLKDDIGVPPELREGHDLRGRGRLVSGAVSGRKRRKGGGALLPGKAPNGRPLFSGKGMTVDEAAERAWAAGYFGPSDTTPRPTVAEMIDHMTGSVDKPVYHPQDLTQLADRAESHQLAGMTERQNEARGEVDKAGRDYGIELNDEEVADIADRMIYHDVSPHDAILLHINDLLADDLQRAYEDAGYDPDYEAPARTDERPGASGAAPGDGGAGGERRAGEPAIAGEAGAGGGAAGEARGQEAVAAPAGLDRGAAIDPNVAARQRQELDIRAQQPLAGARKTGVAQSDMMPEGLFGGPPEPDLFAGDGEPGALSFRQGVDTPEGYWRAQQAHGFTPDPVFGIVDRHGQVIGWEANHEQAAAFAAERGGTVTELNPADFGVTDPRMSATSGEKFSDPNGPAAQEQAADLDHTVRTAIDAGQMEGMAFGVDATSGLQSAADIVARFDGDDAAIQALKDCL